MDEDLKDQKLFTPKLVSKFVMVTNLVLVLPRLLARAHFYEQLAMVVGRARLPWEFLIHNYIGEHLCTNLCILCRLCDRRHTFTAHSATVISKGQSNVEMRCIAVLATVSDDPRPHSQPFYCSHCVLQSLDVLKFSPPSLLCALNFLHHPDWLRTSPSCVLQSSLTCPSFYASRTIKHHTQRGANPDSGRVTPGPMTIQTMKAWNSFPC